MSHERSLHELHEHLEHAVHQVGLARGEEVRVARRIGLTMAGLAAALAISSALVSSERHALLAATLEQSAAEGRHQAILAKYRLLQSQLVSLHAFLVTNPASLQDTEKQIDSLARLPGPSSLLIRVQRLEAKNLTNAVNPSGSDAARLGELAIRTGAARDAAQSWAESYHALVEAHRNAAASYQWAELAAELGVLLAGLALLFLSRPLWVVAFLLGLGSVALMGRTWFPTDRAVTVAMNRVQVSEAGFHRADQEKADDLEDKKLIEEVLRMAPKP